MDWNAAIERNREALKRVLASLRAMAKIEADPHPEGPEDGRDPWLALKAEGEPRRTMPRILHRAVLRLLRPAEAATRRLIIVAARGLVVSVPPPRTPPLKGEGLASASESSSPLWGSEGRGGGFKRNKPTKRVSLRKPCLPLFDPPQHFGRPRRPSRAFMPRISVPGVTAWSPLPPPPSPFDELDTAALARRVAALGAALDDLPKHARRFALWQTRRDAALVYPPPLGVSARFAAGEAIMPVARWQGANGRELPQAAGPAPNGGHEIASGDVERGGGTTSLDPHPAASRRPSIGPPQRGGWKGRVWPLRPGRPPGRHSPREKRPPHEVHEILGVVHGLALWAMEPPDTS